MMRATLPFVVAAAMLLVACTSSAPAAPPPFKPVADMKQLMNAVVDPAADVVWNSVGTTISAAGTEERFPKTDEEWTLVLNGAITLTESGNLMMIGSRAKDTGDWMKMSQDLVDVGIRTIKAAQAKNKDAIFDVGGDIYTACANCHRKYAEEAESAPK
jgi:hypothetical protein